VWFFDLLLILSLTLWLLKLGLWGALSPEFIGVVLIALVFFVALGRRTGMGFIRTVFRVGVPLASLAAFAVWHGRGDPAAMTAILGTVGALVLALFGYYVIFGGLRRKR
jgi:hypothetical protein